MSLPSMNKLVNSLVVLFGAGAVLTCISDNCGLDELK